MEQFAVLFYVDLDRTLDALNRTLWIDIAKWINTDNNKSINSILIKRLIEYFVWNEQMFNFKWRS